MFRSRPATVAAAALLLCAAAAVAQKIVWSALEKPIADRIASLRQLPDDVRARVTKELALQIRQLPAETKNEAAKKLELAGMLANLSTEGDFGHDTLQGVATTLAEALHQRPGGPPSPYVELAQLVRYEHVQAALDDPQFAAAFSKLEADDQRRQQADFTLADLQGVQHPLKDLRGKVVLVNFWATWCPPCRKELPDLETLYTRFKDRGLVVLAISDEDAGKVKPFIAARGIQFPILLDPGRKVNELFQIEGIPKSFVYDRGGKLVAQSIDMRTMRQFQEMLSRAGLE